jgi:hypothetical protein
VERPVSHFLPLLSVQVQRTESRSRRRTPGFRRCGPVSAAPEPPSSLLEQCLALPSLPLSFCTDSGVRKPPPPSMRPRRRMPIRCAGEALCTTTPLSLSLREAVQWVRPAVCLHVKRVGESHAVSPHSGSRAVRAEAMPSRAGSGWSRPLPARPVVGFGPLCLLHEWAGSWGDSAHEARSE